MPRLGFRAWHCIYFVPFSSFASPRVSVFGMDAAVEKLMITDLKDIRSPVTKLDSQQLSVVVPVYNEARTLSLVVTKLLTIPHLLEIIIVDDGSTDATGEIAASLMDRYPQVRVERLKTNTGKTAALRAGFQMTRGSVVIVQDADLEYDPEEIAEVIRPILEGYADVVFGSRFLV